MFVDTFSGSLLNLALTTKLEVVDHGDSRVGRDEEPPASSMRHILKASLAGGGEEIVWRSEDEEECFDLLHQIETALESGDLFFDCGEAMLCDVCDDCARAKAHAETDAFLREKL